MLFLVSHPHSVKPHLLQDDWLIFYFSKANVFDWIVDHEYVPSANRNVKGCTQRWQASLMIQENGWNKREALTEVRRFQIKSIRDS